MQDGFPAHFSNGRSAGRVSAQLVLAPGRLEVRGGDGLLLAGWRYKDIRLQDAVRPGEPMRLHSVAEPDARLAVLNVHAIEELRRRLASINGTGGGIWRTAGWALAAGLGAVAVVWGLYAALPAIARPIARAIPLEWEEKVGDNMAQSALKGMHRCPAGEGLPALNGLVAELVAANKLERRFTLHVVQDKLVNAFAMPGGHIVLLSGLIEDAQSPDELAAVVAHEMSHIIERHASERLVRAAGVGLLFTWLTGDPSSIIAGAGGMMVNLSYSRGDEAEADARAVALLERSGLGTGGLGSFFLRLGEHQGKDSMVPELLSTHPRSTERAAAHAAKDGRKALSEAQWQAVKALCR